MVLVNAIYYKANWLHPFVKALTTAQDFQLADGVGSVRHNNMMIHPRIYIRAGFDIEALDGASVLELPYENEDFNMYVGLPGTYNKKKEYLTFRGFFFDDFSAIPSRVRSKN